MGWKTSFLFFMDPNDSRLERTEFGCYSETQFANDLLSFNNGQPLSDEQTVLVRTFL